MPSQKWCQWWGNDEKNLLDYQISRTKDLPDLWQNKQPAATASSTSTDRSWPRNRFKNVRAVRVNLLANCWIMGQNLDKIGFTNLTFLKRPGNAGRSRPEVVRARLQTCAANHMWFLWAVATKPTSVTWKNLEAHGQNYQKLQTQIWLNHTNYRYVWYFTTFQNC